MPLHETSPVILWRSHNSSIKTIAPFYKEVKAMKSSIPPVQNNIVQVQTRRIAPEQAALMAFLAKNIGLADDSAHTLASWFYCIMNGFSYMHGNTSARKNAHTYIYVHTHTYICVLIKSAHTYIAVHILMLGWLFHITVWSIGFLKVKSIKKS